MAYQPIPDAVMPPDNWEEQAQEWDARLAYLMTIPDNRLDRIQNRTVKDLPPEVDEYLTNLERLLTLCEYMDNLPDDWR